VDFMQSVGNNRVGVPELCYANIYEIAWSGYHIDIKATENNSALVIFLVLYGLRSWRFPHVYIMSCTYDCRLMFFICRTTLYAQYFCLRVAKICIQNYSSQILKCCLFFFFVSMVRCREWFNCTIMHSNLKITGKQTYYYSACKTLQRICCYVGITHYDESARKNVILLRCFHMCNSILTVSLLFLIIMKLSL
jgi:hypothetical protein